MSARVLMLQGTGSDVGKSLLVAGLCRAAVRRGLKVRPFKPQNMSNNAAVTADGGEIGRAQALQARACGVAPTTDMNPVLLKPETDRGAQVVVQGRVRGHAGGRSFQGIKPTLMPAVLESFGRLCGDADLVLVEGAGSPAEVNLRAGDIANMGFATVAGVPVVLVGDIDRGGVIASLVGTHALLPPEERALVAGYLINKFRGDIRLFDDGLAEITNRTGWPGFGVVPWLSEAAKLPAEDAASLENAGPAPGRAGRPIRIAVPRLSRISNFDDYDPLAQEPDVDLRLVPPGQPLPGDADLIILPGTKATIADLAFLREQGWDIDIKAHARRGGRVMGICGGYQMLGKRIVDAQGIEGLPETVDGLGLLDVVTTMSHEKTLVEVTGRDAVRGAAFTGYEMHLGRTAGPDAEARPMLTLANGRPDGARSPDGRIEGCYVHGLFAADPLRHAILSGLSARGASGLIYEDSVDAALDAVAQRLEACIDVTALLNAAVTPGEPRNPTR